MCRSLDFGNADWTDEDRCHDSMIPQFGNRFMLSMLIGDRVVEIPERMFESCAVEIADAVEGIAFRCEPVAPIIVIGEEEASKGAHPHQRLVV